MRNAVVLLAFVVSCAAALSSEDISDKECARFGLVPRPKSVNVLGRATIRPPVLLLGDGGPAARWLADRLEAELRLSVAPSGEGYPIRFLRRRLEHGAEAYRLEITSRGATMIAAGDAGFFRAVGRFLAISESPAVSFEAGSLSCPALRISDWPDIPIRGMHLQMAFSPDDSTIGATVEAMARLGFNMAGYELGGCFEYRSHPECRFNPVRTQEQVRTLVAFAKARGITPIPCINAVDHTDRAPQVFIIPDADWKRRVMDLTNPAFYPTFFDLVDELVETFEQPPYIHIGTDECADALAKLSKLKGIPADRLYAEFVNRVSRHLKDRGVRTVIWSDMLLRPDEAPGEPANASDDVPTDKTRDMLDKDIIVDYWCYSPRPYRGLEILRDSGFTTWASPWRDRNGVPRLCLKADQLDLDTVFGTTWSNPVHVADGLVLTAEYAWNAPSDGDIARYDPQAVANDLLCRRPLLQSGPTEAVNFSNGATLPEKMKSAFRNAGLPLGRSARFRGIEFDLTKPVSFAAGEVKHLRTHADIERAAAGGKKILVSIGDGLVFPVDGVNQPRNWGQTIVYITTEKDKSTGTNRWGREWIVERGTVVRIADGGKVGGNSPIPPDGYVISAHAVGPPSGYAFLSEHLAEGAPVELVTFSPPDKPVESTANVHNARVLAILMTSYWSVQGPDELAQLVVETTAGRRYPLSLQGSAAVPAFRQVRWHYPPERENGWRLWQAWSNYDADKPAGVLAYEWHAPTGERASRLHLTVTPAGQMAGFAVLAASAW